MPLDLPGKEKEMRLLHLDHVQKDLLRPLIDSFLNNSPIEIKTVVEAFKNYTLALLKLSFSAEVSFCNLHGELNNDYDIKLGKFVDAVSLCSKLGINYHKIFESGNVTDILAKLYACAEEERDNYLHEMSYVVQYEAYLMLESRDARVRDYMGELEHFYMSSLAVVNPYMAKKLFVDHIADIMRSNQAENTMSDIVKIINKYTAYLGKTPPPYEKIEELMYQYGGDDRIEQGMLHAAKIEIFKILQ